MVNSLIQQNTKPFRATLSERSEDFNLAAIDIGTNSIHMAIARVQPSLPSFSIIAREKDTVRLGDRDPKTKCLTAEAMKRALATLRRCQDLAASFNVAEVVAVATSAMREAPNGQDFLLEIASQLGLEVNLISGQEEARRIYLGVFSCMDFQNQPHVIIDIGGGSTELILADSNQPRFLSSTKIGAVRLTQDFVRTDPISPQELGYLQAYVRGMLERPADELRARLQPSERLRGIGTSGTIKTLATIDAIAKSGNEPNPLHGYTLAIADLEAIAGQLAVLPEDERAKIPGMDAKRSEIIIAGAVVLLEAMKMLRIDRVQVCERALREGVLVDWMLTHGLIEDKLRYQSEVRERNTLKIARKYQVDLAHSDRIANFSLSLFDQTHGLLHHWGDTERELLWAAALLHNCGMYISHASHHKHSYYLIRNAELLGFSELELELIANIARYHRKSKPKKRHLNFTALASKDHRLLVSQASAILRLAVALDRRQIGAISRVKCDYRSRDRELCLELTPANPNDPCELELWNLDYKKCVFEEEFGVKVTARLS